AERVGPFVGTWLGNREGPDLLVLARRVLGSRDAIQGYFVDWNALRPALENQVADLLEGARVEPLVDEVGAADHRLATLPATLSTASTTWERPGALATAWRRLGAAWLAAFVALVAVGVMLRASMDLAGRRERFAAAVAHELRTPIT